MRTLHITKARLEDSLLLSVEFLLSCSKAHELSHDTIFSLMLISQKPEMIPLWPGSISSVRLPL